MGRTKLTLTDFKAKEGKGAGADLLGKRSLDTEVNITQLPKPGDTDVRPGYIENVMEKRGAVVWAKREEALPVLIPPSVFAKVGVSLR
jgi:hypothetical protein